MMVAEFINLLGLDVSTMTEEDWAFVISQCYRKD